MMILNNNAVCLPLFILVFSFHVTIILAQYNKVWDEKYENNKCPRLYPKNFVNYAPAGE